MLPVSPWMVSEEFQENLNLAERYTERRVKCLSNK